METIKERLESEMRSLRATVDLITRFDLSLYYPSGADSLTGSLIGDLFFTIMQARALADLCLKELRSFRLKKEEVCGNQMTTMRD